jgi:hypothetical protein
MQVSAATDALDADRACGATTQAPTLASDAYGLGRFPVTLYREQWEKLLGMADEIRTFIRENYYALKKKQ